MADVTSQRTRLLVQLEQMLERPMFILAIIWIGLLILDLARGLDPVTARLVNGIWIIFIVDFAVKFIIAPRKREFLRRNWATALSLLLPAFRVLRVARAFRAARVARSLRFAKLLGSTNRGMRALRRTMRRRGFGYVLATTLLVIFSGAAGMMTFEREGENAQAFQTYGSSLWWTSMLVMMVGSEFWPRTAAGRMLTLLLAVYGLAVLGYITATLASFFVDQDRD